MRKILSLIFCVAMLACVCAPAAAQSTLLQGGASYDVIAAHYKETTGPPRVEQVTEHIWAAIGYDLANVVLIRTDAGSVIVDTAMSPERAREIRAALAEHVPVDPVAAVIYTHSHIDHIGGATVWAPEGVPIWSTDALAAHMFKQYGIFMPIETLRGGRQFGRHVPAEINAYSALGKQVDIDAALENGVLLPTHTFEDTHTLTIGGLDMVLQKAPGETHDQLFVWVPADRAVISGDNFYWSFPNLYTLRGASPRPVAEWIRSLDAIRALDPAAVIPCHNKPLVGEEQVRSVLTDYRDAIQWVYDATVRGANAGLDMDTLAESIALPPHLADKEYAKQFYGQVDWSVRAIYTNNLGWFDGSPEDLYVLPKKDAAQREVALMGGNDAVLEQARKAMDAADWRWAVHLLGKLRHSGPDQATAGQIDESLIRCYEALADMTYNTNGRAYLLESAYELRNGIQEAEQPELNQRLVSAVPLEHIFSVMSVKLDAEKALDVHESALFVFPDEKRKFTVTVRRGVAEVVEGEPLPGTPEPVATLVSDADTFRQMALGIAAPAAVFAAGKIKIKGSMPAFMAFMKRFETGQ